MVQFPHASSTEQASPALKILALETSGDRCSAALLIGEQVEQRYEKAPRRHADLILGMMDSLLSDAAMSLNELDAIAYGRGPGSFTGVRIAAAVAQGAAFGAGLSVIGISTLAALAQAAYRETGRRRIACALDARMGEVYWGCYRVGRLDEGGGTTLLDQELVIAPQQTPTLAGSGWCGAGSGWNAFPALRERHEVALKSDDLAADETTESPLIVDCAPQASDIAWLARAASDEAQRPDRASPVYLRNQVAVVAQKTSTGG